jgi:hypothetical protein
MKLYLETGQALRFKLNETFLQCQLLLGETKLIRLRDIFYFAAKRKVPQLATDCKIFKSSRGDTYCSRGRTMVQCSLELQKRDFFVLVTA